MTSLFPKDNLSPSELQAKQAELMKQARSMLDPEHFAELLIDRSYGVLGRALSTLLDAAHDLRRHQVATEELDESDLAKVNDIDVRQAFNMLIEHFGAKCIYEMVEPNMMVLQYLANSGVMELGKSTTGSETT